MRMNLKHCVWIVVSVGLGIGGGAVQAVGAPLFQDHDPDYSKTKTYQQGVREGKDDRADIELQPLSSINQIFERLKHGDVASRMVLHFARS